MRNAFIDELVKIAKKDKNVLMMCGDLGYNVLKEFYENMPEQFINAGIAEQNMMSVASALGLEKKKVYVYSIGNFTTLRCLEQIRNDVLYHDSNVKIISVGSGFGYGALGMSHHATEDLGIMRCLPNLTIFTPSDPEEAKKAAELSYNLEKPCFIRLGKGNEPSIHEKDFKMEIGKAIEIIKGTEAAIFVAGPGSIEGLNAAKELNEMGISTALYSFPTIKPIDENLIRECFKNYKVIVTLEEHNIIGGLRSAVAEIASTQINNAVLRAIGLKDTFASTVGSQEYLREVYKINKNEIIHVITKELRK